MNYFQGNVHIVQENMTNIIHLLSCYSKNINEKTTHFCNANLEIFFIRRLFEKFTIKIIVKD